MLLLTNLFFQIVWDNKLADRESEPYQQLSYEAIRAVSNFGDLRFYIIML